jgi:hypothetical protein
VILAVAVINVVLGIWRPRILRLPRPDLSRPA